MVENALMGLVDNLVYNKELFSCLTCYACQLKCPSDVDYPLFIRKMRALASNAEQQGDCAHSGVLQSLMRLMARNTGKQKRLEWLPDGCSTSERGDIMLFIGCAPYFEPVFEDTGARPLEIARDCLKILNQLGIEPVLLPDEKCCGHDMLWTGDIETFDKLAHHNADVISDAGIKKIIFYCPECYRTFKEDYPEFVQLDCELQHISEFLVEKIEEGEIHFNETPRRVTYHDPCRLGRHLGVYEPPRKLIESIPGVELVEMKQNREESLCCGTSAFTNCNVYSKQIRVERLLEARATGADLLVTACPKCQIHFKCAMVNKGKEKGPDIGIEVIDIVNLVASTLRGGNHE
jgi:Fe-S oxidoreductase